MLTVSLTLLLCLVYVSGQGFPLGNATAIEEALVKGQQLESLVRSEVGKSIPPTQTAAAAAEELLQTMHTSLGHCADELKRKNDIPLYEECIATIKKVSYMSLGEVLSQQWAIYGATSGATRLGFFLW